jgi:hypothetical protein
VIGSGRNIRIGKASVATYGDHIVEGIKCSILLVRKMKNIGKIT